MEETGQSRVTTTTERAPVVTVHARGPSYLRCHLGTLRLGPTQLWPKSGDGMSERGLTVECGGRGWGKLTLLTRREFSDRKKTMSLLCLLKTGLGAAGGHRFQPSPFVRSPCDRSKTNKTHHKQCLSFQTDLAKCLKRRRLSARTGPNPSAFVYNQLVMLISERALPA
ncbi:hypothetical protein BaRGS_00031255 [Batillaria attramentaria]|uniref:Uncharacterized protein n=1 Tax=Batillaria attramentaria TaxID=370345 RepID=A0ABD0JRF7_9CAEN